MPDDSLPPFSFPAVSRKKVTAAFDGGRITSDGGVLLLAEADRRLGLADKLASVIADPRDPSRVIHPLPDILRTRILAIACGWEDANDLDTLRRDPAFKLACGRLPDSGRDLCSQPTVSRWENAPTLREILRLMAVMVDVWCASYPTPPAAVTLDIDDTLDVVHGHQQLSLFNAHYDERCFLPIHIYDTATGRPVAMILRPDRGDHAGPRHPLRRHQPGLGVRRVHLRHALLPARPGREPDQAAQGATGLGSDLVPVALGQSDAPDPPYRRLLADAHRPRRHPQDPCPGQGRIQHHSRQAAETWRSRRRNHGPRPPRLRGSVPPCRLDPPDCNRAPARRAVTAGAVIAPIPPLARKPQDRTIAHTVKPMPPQSTMCRRCLPAHNSVNKTG